MVDKVDHRKRRWHKNQLEKGDPTVDKRQIQDEVEKEMAKFIKNGGEITKIEIGKNHG